MVETSRTDLYSQISSKHQRDMYPHQHSESTVSDICQSLAAVACTLARP